MSEVLFAHLTDAHLMPTKTELRQGVNPYERLRSAVEHLRSLNLPLDFVIQNGDCAGGDELGQASSYLLADELFATLGVPILHVSGNHDDPSEILRRVPSGAKMLGLDSSRSAYWLEFGKLTVIVLDGRVDEGPDGHLYEDQLEDVIALLTGLADDQRVIISVHFPVHAGDVAWFNGFADKGKSVTMLLADGMKLHNIARAYSGKVLAIFHGHTHQGMDYTVDGVRYICAASTQVSFNTLPGATTTKPYRIRPVPFNLLSVHNGALVNRPEIESANSVKQALDRRRFC